MTARSTLEGRTAVVTGGGRGIGLAYCRRLAADGANVVIVDINDPVKAVEELVGAGDRLGMVCDASDAGQVEALGNSVVERFGRCDIFVNNAATLPVTSLEGMTGELWRRVHAINVEPIITFARQFVPAMKAVGWGRIVTTGSSVTLHPQVRDLAYMSSKGSVHGVTRALANELGDTGITVNSIAPTVVMTEGFTDRTADTGLTPEKYMDMIVSQQTIMRPCVPADLANLLSFLVSDEADFITGQIIHIDGGRTRSGA